MSTSEAQKIRCKRYWDRHRDELNAKQRAKLRKQQDARLDNLIEDYDTGVELSDLKDKYRVVYRKKNGESI